MNSDCAALRVPGHQRRPDAAWQFDFALHALSMQNETVQRRCNAPPPETPPLLIPDL